MSIRPSSRVLRQLDRGEPMPPRPWLAAPTIRSLGWWVAQMPDGYVRDHAIAGCERAIAAGEPLVRLLRADGAVAGYALVDADTYEWACERSWHLSTDGYARTGRGRHKDYLHRAVMGCEAGDGVLVDHRNRDRLDCRQDNMRRVDRTAQQQNVPGQRGSTSRYRGVFQNQTTGMWTVQVRDYETGSRKTHTFTDEDEAGEFARDWRLANMPGAVD